MMIEVSKLRLELTEIINQAAYAGTPYIVTKNGHEVVAIISIKDFKKLEALKNSESKNLKKHPSKIKKEKKFESIKDKNFFTLEGAAHFMGKSDKWLRNRIKHGFINVCIFRWKKENHNGRNQMFSKTQE
jgi:prevent-host-death family protein